MFRNMFSSKSQYQLRVVQNNVKLHRKDLEHELRQVARRRAEDLRRQMSLIPLFGDRTGRESTRSQIVSSSRGLFLDANRPRENRQYVGRAQVLSQLHCYFEGPKDLPSEPVSCLLYGLAGIGKTQTALRYSYMAQNKYQYIFWVSGQCQKLLSQSFGAIASKLNLASAENANEVSVATRVREWLQNSGMCSSHALYDSILLTKSG